MSEKILIVNEKGKVIGEAEKERCHKGNGILHQGFLVMVFNDKNQLLLTKRSTEKMLWPDFWDGSVASHFHKGENLKEAVKRRVEEEIGVSFKNLKYLGKFRYFSRYKNIGSENEICYLFSGKLKGKVLPNKSEVSDYKFLSLKELKKNLEKKAYTPWLKIALQKFKTWKNNKL